MDGTSNDQQVGICVLMDVIKSMPLPSSCANWNKVIELQVIDKNLAYTWVIHGDTWEVQEGGAQNPDLVFRGKESEFIESFTTKLNSAILPKNPAPKFKDTIKIGGLIGKILMYYRTLTPQMLSDVKQQQAEQAKVTDTQVKPRVFVPAHMVRGSGMKAITIGTIKPDGPVAIDLVNGQLAIGCGGLLGQGTGYRLYKLNNFNTFQKLPIDWSAPQKIVFDQSGDVLAAAEMDIDYYIAGWAYDVMTGKVNKFKMGGPRWIYANGRGGSDAVSISPNGRFLVLASAQERAMIFDLHGNESQYLDEKIYPDRKFFAWTNDGKTLASAHDQVTLEKNDTFRQVELWSFPKGEDSELSEISSKLLPHFPDGNTQTGSLDGCCLGMDFSLDSRLLAAGGGARNKGIIQIVDMQTNTILMQSQNLPSDVRFLKFTPSGEHLISGDRNGNLTIWKLQTAGTPKLKEIETEKLDGTILALALGQPDDGLFVATKYKGGVNVSQISLPFGVN